MICRTDYLKSSSNFLVIFIFILIVVGVYCYSQGLGFRACLEFGMDYRRASAKISKEKRRFLVVVASGGLNQQRNEIIDAVVIARILETALVIPVLQVNLILGDESEFSDTIFDAEHFKRTLQADVRVVSSLPSTHIVPTQTIARQIPQDITPQWIRSRFFRKLNDEGVLVLKGLDAKLSKNLPPDLQKVRCKVAFHALRFAPPIRELGDKLTRRMWIEGSYVALHLRLEKDVWVRTGCRTGLGAEVDRAIAEEQESRPEYLTGRLSMSYDQRRLAGLCPLNAAEVARLLKALGAPRNARLYIAGGEPLGGEEALLPLKKEFPDLMTKESLAKEGELAPYVNRSSALAAIDYIISLSSDVFMPSHGGNMGRAMQGHRAYIGHRKYIKPNKRAMLPFFEDATLSDGEFGKRLHKHSLGQPQWRNNQRDRNVIAYPVPECMCNS
ncbi:O-fucosyltransferase 37 [Ranunculus cassubicifolius]